MYNVLRNVEKSLLKMCNMADFQVFAAAMMLVVDLLTCSRTAGSSDPHHMKREWQLVSETANELKRVSQSIRNCDVAALEARVLKDFSNSQTGPADGFSNVDIPYFGRNEI